MRNGLTAFIAGFAALAGPTVAVAQSAPQTLPIEVLLLPPKHSVDRVLAAATPQTGGAGFNLSAPPLPPSFQPFRPVSQPAAAAAPANKPPTAKPVMTASAFPDAPLPVSATPPTPAVKSAPVAVAAVGGPAGGPPPQGAAQPSRQAQPAAKPTAVPAPPGSGLQTAPAVPAPIVTAAAPTAASSAAAAPAPRTAPLTEREIVEKANAYFTGLSSLVADFTQIGADGRRLGGTLYLQRPGKLRFEYDKPATLEVVADGSQVAVQDTKLATQDLYPISQTPLKFLLRERVNLGQDIKITGIANDGDAVRLSLEDKSTLGGTSKITLFFDPAVETLTQWRIVDPQGYQTTVMLNKPDRTRRIDQKLFVINVNSAIKNDNPNR